MDQQSPSRKDGARRSSQQAVAYEQAAGKAARPRMRLVIACDHRGFAAKALLAGHLTRFDCDLLDLGCDGSSNCDYPDYAAPAARMVASGEADAAVLLDGSGIGMGIVANKIRGIRAATAHDEITARIAREHNHCNVLCVGTDLVSEKALARIVEIFLTTPFAEGRHVRRVAKIAEIEQSEADPTAALKMSSSA
jgi:ribose 5-phosphate isomerase B